MSSSGWLIFVLGLSLVGNTHGVCRTDKNERCIFPFIFHGITFNSCTQAESDRYWCATEVRASGQAFNTGWCDSNCPTDDLPFSSTGGAKPSRSSAIAATQSFRNSGRRCSNTSPCMRTNRAGEPFCCKEKLLRNRRNSCKRVIVSSCRRL